MTRFTYIVYQPHIPSHFYACTPIKAKKRFTFEKASITSIVFRKNIKVAFWLMIWSFWSWIFLQFVLFTKIFIYQYYQISYYYATVPLFHGNFRKKSKLFWKTAGVTQLFSKVHLKKCYCDARYLGKSVGDPLKIHSSKWVNYKKEYLLAYTRVVNRVPGPNGYPDWTRTEQSGSGRVRHFM